MEDYIRQLQSHFEIQPVPQPPQNINCQEMAAEQVKMAGPGLDPSQAQLATVMATIQLRSEHESKLSVHLLQKTLLETVKSVSSNKQEISQLRLSVNHAVQNSSELQKMYNQIMLKVNQAEVMAFNANTLAAETKQKSSKGNFIVSGEHVPRPSQNENLANLVCSLMYRKYGISMQYSEFKALHRLPNNKILFSLHSRLPGQSFHQLTRAMNFNPNPSLKAYVSIQLFEPFAELYYIARRLKHYKCITNYRLDDNGNTHIAVQADKMSFKFTGIDQLQSLNIHIPQQLFEEVTYRRNQIKDNETRGVTINNEKAFKVRTNYGQHQNGKSQTQTANSLPHQSSSVGK